MQKWAFPFSKDPTFCLVNFLVNMVPFRFTKNFQLVFYKLKRFHKLKILEILSLFVRSFRMEDC